MKFTVDTMKIVLRDIEEHLSFQGDDISNPQNWDIKSSITTKEILDKHPEQKDEYRYCLFLMRAMDYIEFSGTGTIKVNKSGYKFILNTLHNVQCMY